MKEAYNSFTSFVIKNPEIKESNKESFIWYHFNFSNMYFQVLYSSFGFYFGYVCLYNATKNKFTVMSLIKNLLINKLRTLPLIWLLLFFYMRVFPYTISGPLSNYYYNSDKLKCSDNNNYYGVMFLYSIFNLNKNSDCFRQVSFFYSETIYFIISTLVMVVCIKKKSKALFFILSLFIVVVGLVVKLFIIIQFDLGKNSRYADIFNDINSNYLQYNVYSNISDYIIGMFFGIGYFKFGFYENQDRKKEVMEDVSNNEENSKYTNTEDLGVEKLNENYCDVLGSKL